jgi:phthalate 4,5-dioxygenase oxygenase subunit
MLTAESHEILTRSGAETPMGALMREYWIPAIQSTELVADGAPLRLMLLGEKLIAFRDSSGHVGVMDHRCPHRCASLFFGRNECHGIRCVYHGWKFDIHGVCKETPNVHTKVNLARRIRAKSYRVAERNGLIWVYMGSRDKPPDLPSLAVTLFPENQVTIQFVQRECNWLQALEGDIDTSHFGFLHTGSVSPDDLPEDHQSRYAVVNRVPDYHVSDTACGLMYGAHRPTDAGQTYWRFAHFLFPFWTMPPDGDFHCRKIARAWVPMDDTHTMAVILRWKMNAPAMRTLKDGRRMPGTNPDFNYLPNSSGWYGRWRLIENRLNDYNIDRDLQRSGNFTGIDGIFLQDHAITESMGAIVDHAMEHLCASDIMIARTRQRLVNASLNLRDNGTEPPGVSNPLAYGEARSGDFIISADKSAQDAYREKCDEEKLD